MLFVGYSSPFNTRMPAIVITQLDHIQIPPGTCNFLTNQPQSVQLSLSTGLRSQTLTCIHMIVTHLTNIIINYADDTTHDIVVGLISDGDELA